MDSEKDEVHVSFFEIYNEKIYDLLSDEKKKNTFKRSLSRGDNNSQSF